MSDAPNTPTEPADIPDAPHDDPGRFSDPEHDPNAAPESEREYRETDEGDQPKPGET